MKNFFKSNWILLVILGLALFFRFYQIGTLPGGLFPDEAANGLDVNSILKGHLQPFYERGNGREALFFYVIAAAVAIFGRGPWQHHIVSAGFGFFEVLATYFLVKRMFGKRTAYLASFFMAVSSYAVTISRTAFRANTIPLFTTLTILFLIRAYQSPDRRTKIWSGLLSGISFGLGFYTYISYRMMIPLLCGFAVLLLFSLRGRIKESWAAYGKPFWAWVLGFAASFSWLGYYFFTHPGSFVGRAGQVSIFSKELNHGDVVGTFLAVFKATILSFFTEGDLNWRHNVSGFPFLSPFLSPFFAVSVILFSLACLVLLRQIWKKTVTEKILYMSLVAVWFWFMLAPEVTTAEGIPHGLRLIGVIPPIFILAAWSVNWLYEKLLLNRTFYRGRLAFGAIFLGSILVYNFYLYFGIAAQSPDYYYAFRSDLTDVSGYLNARDSKQTTYLSLDAFSVQTVDYLTTATNNPYNLLVPENTYQVKLKTGDQVVFTQSTLYDITKFRVTHPRARLIVDKKNKFNQTIMQVYEQ
ncbi:MAG: ArnT family glycosyltransferase [Candidatus Saccharibacteria bacterium]